MTHLRPFSSASLGGPTFFTDGAAATPDEDDKAVAGTAPERSALSPRTASVGKGG
jgi:hypothetical protein